MYRFLRDDLGAEYIQFIPIVERPSPGGIPTGDQVTDRSVSPDGYGAFLSTVFDEWVRRDVGTVFVQMFDTTLANYLDVPGGMCVHARTCGTAVALEHNGDLYSCDHFVEPDNLLGNITETPMLELIASPKQVAFGQAKHDDLPGYCRTCTVRFACHGGCPKDRFTTTPDGEPGLHYLCPSYKAFFTHVDRPMRFMAAALRTGRLAEDVIAWMARTDARATTPDLGRRTRCRFVRRASLTVATACLTRLTHGGLHRRRRLARQRPSGRFLGLTHRHSVSTYRRRFPDFPPPAVTRGRGGPTCGCATTSRPRDPPAPPRRRPTSAVDRKREAILDATAQLIASQAITDVSVREIARAPVSRMPISPHRRQAGPRTGGPRPHRQRGPRLHTSQPDAALGSLDGSSTPCLHNGTASWFSLCHSLLTADGAAATPTGRRSSRCSWTPCEPTSTPDGPPDSLNRPPRSRR